MNRYRGGSRRTRRSAAGCALLLAWGIAAAAAEVIYVDAGATGGNNGRSWLDAYVDLQDALARAAPGDEIWVAAAVYTPAPPGDTARSFELKPGVGVYGGFAGGETQRAQRDPLVNRTTLSGDLGRDDEYGNPWYVGWNIHTPNSVHVVTASAVDATAVLDGFTIMAGYATQNVGGGMYLAGAAPTIAHCTFTRNLSGFAPGAAMYMLDSSPRITGCSFVENYVHLSQGTGMMIVGASQPMIQDCDFIDNRCVGTSGGGEAAGAGLDNRSTLPIEIVRCRFLRNVSVGFYPSGDRSGTYAGAIHHMGTRLTVRDCTFLDNWSNAGGAIWTWRELVVVNCLFARNAAPEYHAQGGGWGGSGGAIGATSFQTTPLTVVNCTLVRNSATSCGGLRVTGTTQSDVDNCIFWNNSDQYGMVGPSQIRGSKAAYCCIQNLLVGIPGEDPPDPADFPNCFDRDPRLVDLNGDFHLLPGSPCIDAADNLAVPADVTTDLDGAPRFVDDPDTPDTGRGTPPIVDMGAYEFQAGACQPCDTNCDGAVNALDIEAFIGLLFGGGSACSDCAGDANRDGRIDAFDIEAFIACLFG